MILRVPSGRRIETWPSSRIMTRTTRPVVLSIANMFLPFSSVWCIVSRIGINVKRLFAAPDIGARVL